MIKLFGRNRDTERQMEELKRRHRITTQEADKAIAAANKVLQNGFAIKVYHAQHGSKHAHS